jgi:hypothetical protein
VSRRDVDGMKYIDRVPWAYAKSRAPKLSTLAPLYSSAPSGISYGSHKLRSEFQLGPRIISRSVLEREKAIVSLWDRKTHLPSLGASASPLPGCNTAQSPAVHRAAPRRLSTDDLA